MSGTEQAKHELFARTRFCSFKDMVRSLVNEPAAIDRHEKKDLREILERVLDTEIVLGGDLKLKISISAATLDDALNAGLDWLPKSGFKPREGVEAGGKK